MSEFVHGALGRSAGAVLFLTGAGVSAESGIPTFRGEEGYWRVGSRNYRPMELATFEAFSRVPSDVWGWYLYRRSVCRGAKPNAAHEAIARLDETLGERFLLVTQNVDGLHLRSGNSKGRTYEIHGNIDFMRCSATCTRAVVSIPPAFDVAWERGRLPTAEEEELLTCAHCGALNRPHVLWFDEYYDEEWFRFQSSLAAVDRASVLVVVGTSGSTNLPNQMCSRAAQRKIPMIVVDPEPTPFSALSLQHGGKFLVGLATEHVPAIAAEIARATR